MIGKALKYMRISKKLNQKQLAKKMESAQTTLSGWETGFRQPTFDNIEKIAETCDFEIIFRNKITKEEFQLKDLARKDI